jgi:hypothetical protein
VNTPPRASFDTQADAPAQSGVQDLFSIPESPVASSVAAMGHPGMAGQGFPVGAAAPGLPLQAGVAGVQMAAGAAAPGGAPVLQGAALLGSLTQIQRGDFSAVTGGNFAAAAGGAGAVAVAVDAGAVAGVAGTANILHELKSSVGAGMVAMDRMTLDISPCCSTSCSTIPRFRTA